MRKTETAIYILVLIILGYGIYVLWNNQAPKKNNQKNLSDNNVLEVRSKVADRELLSVNISGVVFEWNGETNVLVIDNVNGRSEFDIDPLNAKVSLVQSQNIYNDTHMYTIYKSIQPLHWRQAFCQGDSVSLLLNKTSGEVDWIMNTGMRMCGFKEKLK